MQMKTAVITGATSGIGWVGACALAARGMRVVFVARSAERADALLSRLSTLNPDAPHAAVLADMSVLSEMRAAAAKVSAIAPVIDVLVNNAGAMFGARQTTPDGLEKTFALNHMSYFVLTTALLENVLAAESGRIVSTSSRAHVGMRLDFDDLQCARRYIPYVAYGRSKLCNILFTRALARRLSGTRAVAACFHPGFVDTQFADSSDGLWRAVFRIGKRLVAISPEAGARTLIHLSTVPLGEMVNGAYYFKCRPLTPTQAARNDADAQRLWHVSSALAGLMPGHVGINENVV